MQGYTIEEIAERRSIARSTVIAHLQTLYEQGEKVNFNEIVSPQEIGQITEAAARLGDAPRLRDLFDYFDGQISFDKLRFAMVFYNKGKS